MASGTNVLIVSSSPVTLSPSGTESWYRVVYYATFFVKLLVGYFNALFFRSYYESLALSINHYTMGKEGHLVRLDPGLAKLFLAHS